MTNRHVIQIMVTFMWFTPPVFPTQHTWVPAAVKLLRLVLNSKLFSAGCVFVPSWNHRVWSASWETSLAERSWWYSFLSATFYSCDKFSQWRFRKVKSLQVARVHARCRFQRLKRPRVRLARFSSLLSPPCEIACVRERRTGLIPLGEARSR